MTRKQSLNKDLQADISELRRRLDAAEATLCAERHMFRDMAETLTDIVFTALPDGSWDFVNARIYEITGLAAGAALGSGWRNALHPEDAGRLTREFREAVVSGTPCESSFRLRTHHGTYRRFITQIQPLRDDSGRITRWIGTATDVDDHLAAEDALDQTRQQHRALMLTLAHDLRNGIAPIAYAAAILKMPVADDAQKQGAVAAIDKQVGELRALLDKISG